MKKNRQIQYKQIYKWKKIGKYNTNKFTNEKKLANTIQTNLQMKKIGKYNKNKFTNDKKFKI